MALVRTVMSASNRFVRALAAMSLGEGRGSVELVEFVEAIVGVGVKRGQNRVVGGGGEGGGVTIGSSLSGDKVGGIGPGVVVDWVSKVVSEVLQWALSSDNSLNKESKHGEHGQPTVLNLLDLELGESLWVVGKAQWVKAATWVKWVSNLSKRPTGNTVTLNGSHQDDLGGPNGQDALCVD
ncbi:hypothetical protein Ahy_A03g010465 [Arachis hypogaea]|uniref:Uncharacterized protein n=1 Tax=Arachis hypogaea TaxID=3818 RepID=A0A445DME9_ARAHY|nr:hypothetical protein Ahy_A03g010465 [Arachis hypogaea]